MEELIFYLYIVLFTAANISKFFVIKNNLNHKRKKDEKENISVLIAAKNEEKNLYRLFNSLKKLNYPEENFEIIFVNDNSTDSTKKVAESFLSQFNNLKVVDAVNKKFPGKKGTIDFGIRNTNFSVVAVTDADCQPNENWLNSISSLIKNNDIIVGLAPINQSENFVNQLSSFENFRNSMLGIWFNKLGLTFSAAARNLAFKKEVYFNINGFEGITKSLSGDDDLLIQKAVKKGYKVFYSTDIEGIVHTDSQTNFKNYFNQKKRHLSTTPFYPFNIKAALFIWHYLNIAMIFCFFVGFIFPFYFILPIIKILNDIIFNSIFQKKFGYTFPLNKMIILIPLYETFLIINYFSSKFGKVVWKE